MSKNGQAGTSGSSPRRRRAPAKSSRSRSGHILDLVFFRLLGVAMIYHETALTAEAEWTVITAAICMFLMPDWVRGKSSLPAKALAKLLEK